MNGAVLVSLNELAAVLFLLTAFLMISARQAQAVLYVYVGQALLLTVSTALLAWRGSSPELAIVAAITLVAKPVAIPILMHRLLSPALRQRREVATTFGIPVSLTIALALAVAAYALSRPLIAGQDPVIAVNLSVGLVVTLLGVFLLVIRREALPQLLALMAIDNGAFFAGIAITSSSALVEFAAALEGIMVVMIVALLARTIALSLGTTEVAAMKSLRERSRA
jgi:hydrogenase-4 component E